MSYTAAAAIKAAEGELGTRETGTNNTPYNHWLGAIPGYPHGGYGYAWCCSFQGWVADQAEGEANRDYPRTAGCEVAVGWFKAHERWSSTPHVGDWVFYGPRGGTHVELVVAVSSSSITTIGGNTSGSLEGRYFNGDGVYRKTVARNSDRIYGYGRPDYEEDDMPSEKALWQWDGIEAPAGPDGKPLNPKNPTWRPDSYLRETYMWVRRVQREQAATQATVIELSKAVAQLAADRGQQVDPDALVQRITSAIENVTVRLDVADESTA
ncbi:CHAP domain-containing protein [Actinomadura sp. WMMA1423]|uniref:CHAP domain-containing protein n=1 Tax=Actinomadura sp. WMMA1423 TaxID=2591108 RepID=UPI00143D48AC|nr:CHAP domain-containing protein [Actinomadura sp. WMMA1423]